MSDLEQLILKNPCAKCRKARRPKCTCGPGNDSKKNKKGGKPANTTHGIHHSLNEKIKLNPAIVLAMQDKINLSEFIAKHPEFQKSLIVEHDALQGKFILKFNSDFSNEKQDELAQQFLQAIQEVFEKFKSALQQKGVNVNAFSSELSNDKEGYKLTLTVPNAQYRNELIDQLSKQLGLQLHEPMNHPVHKPFHPTPLKTRLDRKA